MEKKRVAICFTGQVRTLKTILYYLEKNVFDDSVIYDIFCIAEKKSIDIVQELLHPTLIVEEDVSGIEDLEYKILNNNYKLFLMQESSGRFVRNYLFQLRNLKQMSEVVENYSRIHNIQYDAIVRMRYDFAVLNQLNWKEIFDSIKREKIILASFGVKKSSGFREHMYNDTFAVGSPKNMINYYNQFDELFENLMYDAGGGYQKWFGRYYVSLIGSCKRYYFKIIKKPQLPFVVLVNSLILTIFNYIMPISLYKYLKNPEILLYCHLKKHTIAVDEKEIDFAIVRSDPEVSGHACFINVL